MNNWIMASRLRTLPLSISGILVGTAIAYRKGFFNLEIFMFALITTILFQIISNFSNDLGDALKGTDKNRVGEERMVQSGKISAKQMKLAIGLVSVLAVLSALYLIYIAFYPQYMQELYLFALLTFVAIASALFYTLGNRPYGYFALGDLFVFLFFGILSVIGTEFLYTKNLDYYSFLPAGAIGFFSMAVLNLNNMRDFDSDKANNKITVAILLGKKGAKYYELALLTLPFLLCTFYSVKLFPGTYAPLLFLILLIPEAQIRKKIILVDKDRDYDPFLKQVALLTFAFAILFGLGISGILTF